MSDSALVIKTLEPGDAKRWDAFVEQTPQATFCHLTGWKQVIETVFKHDCPYLYAERAGRIEGVLPLVHVNSRLFSNALISTPFCVYGGTVAETDEARAALDAAACERAERLGVDYLEMREREPQRPDWPSKDLYYTFGGPIGADDDANLKAIPRKQRAVVRKACKNGLEAVIDADVDRLYPLYAYSLRNLGTPVFPKRFLQRLSDVFGDQVEIMTVTHDGQPVSSVLSFYFRDQILPYYAGGADAARALKAHDFMYWSLICHAAGRGVRYFDFGRSKKDTGAYNFKRHWGFEGRPLGYEYFLVKDDQVPDLSPANPRYDRAIKAWQKLPLPVTRVLGPLLARNLG